MPQTLYGIAAIAAAFLIVALARIHLNRPLRAGRRDSESSFGATSSALLATGIGGAGAMSLAMASFEAGAVDPMLGVWALGLIIGGAVAWKAMRSVWSWPLPSGELAAPLAAVPSAPQPPHSPRPRPTAAGARRAAPAQRRKAA